MICITRRFLRTTRTVTRSDGRATDLVRHFCTLPAGHDGPHADGAYTWTERTADERDHTLPRGTGSGKLAALRAQLVKRGEQR